MDDDRDALALIREILEVTGATVVTADSARDALDKLQRATRDVLMADLGMPAMDGFALIDRFVSPRRNAEPRRPRGGADGIRAVRRPRPAPCAVASRSTWRSRSSQAS